jgi:uncharacterized membrane protein YdjX (TVP38/TMEM64 family)
MAIDKQNRRRLLGFVFLCILVLVILKSDRLFLELENILQLTETLIQNNPVIGKIFFVVFSMLSAMLAFFTSALLVPVGVNAWGVTTCFFLLWIGWFLGGLCAYLIGYQVGPAAVKLLIGDNRYQRISKQVRDNVNLMHLIIMQAALPSEVPGYVLGTLRFRIDYYLIALGITELPYALASVALGHGFLQRDVAYIILFLVLGIIILILLFNLSRRFQANKL